MRRRPLRLGFGIFLVLLVVAACDQHDPDASMPTSPVFQAALTLTASAASIPADGFSTVLVTAQISPDADADKRTVEFTTSAGTFVGAPTTVPVTKKVEADASGRAEVELRSSNQIETAVVEAKVKDADDNDVPGLIKRLMIDFTPADTSTVVRISTAAASGDADGVSTVAVFADVAAGIPSDQRAVTFATSLANSSFVQPMPIAPNSSNRATADLKSTVVGTARVTATVNGFTAETTIDFGPARPDSVMVTLDPKMLTQGGGGESTVSVTLARLPGRGTVTDNLQMIYSAVAKATGQSLQLSFTDQSLTNDQAASANVALGGEIFTGTATIRARVEGGSVVGEADLEILPAAP